ncbi:glycosyltransferase family 2 protein [Sporosarcina psychrophila]|uniref:glycosyltransferase family 2 protein n=1 Tax=Sporosarcina psychrophila TaxID=1476 RepID=UPI00078D4323|nr:glycosyltransferase family 2 protein [Sporosarcina psychrophila]AMQ07888.1 hypothetical protein AZE41_19180 [Sporosarcina psychrophila]
MNLSIIIPTYNLGKYIENTLSSLMMQTDGRFELIVVDDGSTDDTTNIVKEIILKNKLINCKVINKENNEGVSSARNTGLFNATGEYVMFLDGDDYVSKNLVEVINKTVENEKFEVICWGFNAVNEDYKSQSNYFEKYSSALTNMKGYEALENIIIEKTLWICTGSAVFKRELLLNENLKYSDDFVNGEDQEFTIKALSVADNVCFINEVLFYYVQREGSISNSYNINRFDAINAMIRTYEYLQGKSDNRFNNIIHVIKNELILGNYFHNFNSCITYLVTHEKRSIYSAQKLLNSDIESKYLGLNQMILTLMGKYTGNNRKLYLQVKLFLFSPFIHIWLVNLKHKINAIKR